MRIGFSLGPAIFGCDGTPWQTADVPGAFLNVFQEWVESCVSGLFRLSGIASGRSVVGVSSGGEVFSLVGGTTAELSSPEWVEGHNHCGSQGKALSPKGDIRFRAVSATGSERELFFWEKNVL